MTSSRITAKRRLVQAVLVLTTVLLPFVSVGGNPFLRMDFGLRTLFLAGVPVRIDQFYIVLVSVLFATVFFLLLTAVLGRVWCGWLCPQTVVNDLADLVSDRFRRRVSAGALRVIEFLTAIFISAVISFSMLGWFLAPDRIVTGLIHAVDHPLLSASFLLMTLLNTLNLLLVKRSFCRSYCPYGRFQAALTDEGTLSLSFLDETRDRCLHCGACVRACPMEIDIRQGFQIECISCGRCIDACRDVMERSGDGDGLIDYRFGTMKGERFRAGPKTVVLGLFTLMLGAGIIWGIAAKGDSSFVVQRVAAVGPRLLPDGVLAQPWRAMIGNRSEQPVAYSIRVAADTFPGVSLQGPVDEITVAPNEHREITFLVRVKRQEGESRPIELQLYGNGRLAGKVTISP